MRYRIHFRLEVVKIHEIIIIFLLTSNKFAIQNNATMQLRLIFQKTIKTNLKSDYFEVIDLTVIQQLRIWKGGGVKFVLLLLFLPFHTNFQYKLSSHTSLFIAISTYFLLLLYLFSLTCNFKDFFSLIFLYKYNEYV